MEFEEKLDNYAKLLVKHGLNVQEGQVANLTGEVIHRQLLNKVAAEAYKAGAQFVNIDLVDPWHARCRLLESKKSAYLDYVPLFTPTKFNALVDCQGAVLRFQGSEEPRSLADLSPEAVNRMQSHYRKSLKRYYDEGVSQSKVHWTVAAAATPKWGKLVFPELEEAAAYQALWEEIFRICRVDQPNFLQLWEQHDRKLQKRAQELTNLKIKELHFIGPGTDLKVYLAPQAKFRGGSDLSSKGKAYQCNIPTEECFTTPDYRLTTGKVKVTCPFLVNGKLIKGMTLEFQQGKITHFEAEEGKETFAAYIQNDEGACRLGEVALVGIDSPIYQSGRVFEEILFDENAACHIAIGFAYRFCIDGSEAMDADALQAIGCNDSSVHTDMMISNDKVDVIATTYSGTSHHLIVQGSWQKPFC